MAVATTVGAIDDFRGLVWWEKLGGQVAAAAIPTGFGIWVHRFTFPIVGVHALPEWVGIPLTILWIVAIMNMVNFLDGLDGLAAGVCAISGFTFCLIALSLHRPNPALLAAVVFGACLGFLRHNFYPARIFMGDSGALLLGFVLGALSVQGLLKTAAVATLRIRRREQGAQVRNASRRSACPGARGIEWPAPGSTQRSAPSRSSSTSQTASNAALWPPDITSFRKGAAASSSSGISASHGA